MRCMGFKISELRKISEANFIKRKPPYQWAVEKAFYPPKHFLYYHLGGQRKILDGDNVYELTPGCVVFFVGGRKYVSPKPEGEYQAMNALFDVSPDDFYITGEALLSDQENYICIPFVSHLRKDSLFKLRFEEIIYCAMSSQPLNNLKAKFLLAEFLVELAKVNRRRDREIPAGVELAISLLEKYPEQSWTLDSLAERVNMSRANLTRNFCKITGKPVRQFHLDQKIKRASTIIRSNPGIRFKEVADILNFYDEYHFSKAFKQKTGISPREFKTEKKG